MSGSVSVTIGGVEVPVSGEHAREAVDSSMFQEWLEGLNPFFRVKSILMQSVDFDHLRKGVRFIKFLASVTDPKGNPLPGIVFMRGGSVVILPILTVDDEDYVILTLQPRFPSGQALLPELPAGTMDSGGTFAGKAAQELEEETGIRITSEDLVDLTALVYGESAKGVYSTPGGSDEYFRVFLFRKEVTKGFIKKLQGAHTGLLEEGEQITLKVVKYMELVQSAPDAKALAAIVLYEITSMNGKI